MSRPSGDIALDIVEELAKLACSVARHAMADDRPRFYIRFGVDRGDERRKQRRRAVALIIMGASLDLSGPHRQKRLRAVERLDLALFVDADHQRFLRWSQIKTDNVA